MLSFLFFILTHPATPACWWWASALPALSSWSNSMVSGGGDVRGPPTAPRLLDDDGARGASRWSGDGDTWTDEVEERRYGALMRTATLVGVIGGILVPMIIWLAVATSYKKGVTDKRAPFPDPVPPEYSLSGGKDFKYQTLQCLDDGQYCMHAYCCPVARVADTFAATGVAPFWTMVMLYLLTWLLAQLLALGISLLLPMLMESLDVDTYRTESLRSNQTGQLCWFAANSALALYFALQRRKLRAKLGDADAGAKLAGDCLCYWCCGCCTYIQDARQVDEASGTRVECCCTLLSLTHMPQMPGMMVGAPVVVGQVVQGQVVEGRPVK